MLTDVLLSKEVNEREDGGCTAWFILEVKFEEKSTVILATVLALTINQTQRKPLS